MAGGIVIMLTGALIGPVFAPTQEETPILRLVWLPVYAATLGLIFMRLSSLVRAWPAWLALLSLIALAFASKYWSLDPEVTQRRVIAMAMTGMFAVYLGAIFYGPHLPRLLMHATLVMAMGSLLMVFLVPSIGVHSDVNAGLWRGLWYEKNQMGLVMVAGATACAACLVCGGRNWALAAAGLFLATVLVLATQSKTSLLSLMLGVGVIFGIWAVRRGGPVLAVVGVWLGVVMASLLLMLIVFDAGALLEALGKDPTLTGRTEIWESLMRRVDERPWTGYGYSAFWGIDSVPANQVRQETGWLVPSAHNGWIDLLVELGWPGAVLVGTLMTSAILGSLLRLGRDGVAEGWFSLGYLAVFALLSTSESVLMTHQALPWVLFLCILTRAVCGDPSLTEQVLVERPRTAYQNRPRIASHSRHGRAPSPIPVR